MSADTEIMERTTPTRDEMPPKDRLVCEKCGRDALTLTADGLPMCARHATIFITMKRLAEGKPVDTR